MRKFEVKKLIRDKIFKKMIDEKSTKIDFEILNNKNFLKQLKKKFYEELEEFDLSDEAEVKNELADLQLILDYFLKNFKISKKELREISKNKNLKVGKFDKKIFLKTIELDDSNSWIEYYQKRYKEIK